MVFRIEVKIVRGHFRSADVPPSHGFNRNPWTTPTRRHWTFQLPMKIRGVLLFVWLVAFLWSLLLKSCSCFFLGNQGKGEFSNTTPIPRGYPQTFLSTKFGFLDPPGEGVAKRGFEYSSREFPQFPQIWPLPPGWGMATLICGQKNLLARPLCRNVSGIFVV